MALLDEPIGSLHGRGHTQTRHDNAQPTTTEARRAEARNGTEGRGGEVIGEGGEGGRKQTDGVQRGDQSAGERQSRPMVRREKTELMGEFSFCPGWVLVVVVVWGGVGGVGRGVG